MLDLFYAGSLVTYRSAYSWEIGRRERVESTGPVDLKAWTVGPDQRGGLDGPDPRLEGTGPCWPSSRRPTSPISGTRATIRPGSGTPCGTPSSISWPGSSPIRAPGRRASRTRPGSSTWSACSPPSRPAPTRSPPSSSPPTPIPSKSSGPCWPSTRAGADGPPDRPEGALEARLELFAALHASFSKEDDRALIRARLSDTLASARKHPWWASGQALLAEFTRAEDAPDALVRARKLALEGAEAYPDSPGGLRCLHVARSIEAPDFSVEMMAADAPGRRSIRFTHRNLAAVHLRAYPVDLAERIRTSKDYNLFPQWDEARGILEKGRPAASWKLDLPATPDFRDHKTYVDLPSGLAPGLYLVAASARDDFARNANSIRALNVIVGDLVILRRASDEGGQDAVVLSGGTGRPVAGASVDLYAFDWQKGHARMETKATDAEGRAHFAPRAERQGPFFLLAPRTRTWPSTRIICTSMPGRSRPRRAPRSSTPTGASTGPARSSTGRSWPSGAAATSASSGRRRTPARRSGSRTSTASGWPKRPVALNGFGTASGEFVIPAAGRPLGAWRLRTSPEGYRPGPGRGIQAADVRSDRQGPGQAPAPEPPGHPEGRGPLLLRASRRLGHGRLAGQARDASIPAGGGGNRLPAEAPRSSPAAGSPSARTGPSK